MSDKHVEDAVRELHGRGDVEISSPSVETFVVLTTLDPVETGRNMFTQRSVGVWLDIEDATATLLSGAGDLNEAGYYGWAVIETCPFGLYPIPDQTNRRWFKWNWDDGETIYPHGHWTAIPEQPAWIAVWEAQHVRIANFNTLS